MSVWKEYKLKDVVSFIDYRGKTPNKKTFGVPLITAKIVKNGVIQEPTEFISFEDYKGWMTRGFPMVGDVVMTTEAPLGEVAQIKDASFALAQRIITMRGKDGLLHSGYLKYFLQSNIGQARLKERETGTTVTGIKSSELKEVLVSAPDYKTQTAIAEILSSLDDKIELNNKINQELENLAQTLFKQWFIDFEFPNENGEPYKSSGGEMVDSELGEIPKGWEVKSLDEIANITIGRTPPRKEHQWFTENSSDVKWISIKDMGNCGTYIMNTSEYLTEAAVAKFNVPIIQKNTVIISFKLTVGRISITTERMLSNEAIAHLNLFDENINPEFIYLYLKQFDFDSLGSTSSIATAVNSKAIKALNFIYPDANVLVNFQEQVSSIFEQILNTTKENQELTNLRDTLLPKLISGELEVADIMAEKA